MPGEGGTSRVRFVIKSELLVFRLSRLGFRFMAGILGLMKAGEQGSERTVWAVGEVIVGAWIDSPFMFRKRLGDGEVIGRSRVGASGTLRVVVVV